MAKLLATGKSVQFLRTRFPIAQSDVSAEEELATALILSDEVDTPTRTRPQSQTTPPKLDTWIITSPPLHSHLDWQNSHARNKSVVFSTRVMP